MAEGEEQKTSEQGLSRVVTAVESAGASVAGLADKLVEEMKSLVKVLGGKAEQAIGPATNIITTLMNQYADEQKAVAKRGMVIGVVCGVLSVVALVLTMLFSLGVYSYHTPSGSGFEFVCVLGAIAFGMATVGLVVTSLVALFDSLGMQAKITSSSVDKLISQSTRLRNGWE